MELSQALELIKGPEGTSVSLTIQFRPGHSRTIAVRREKIVLKNVEIRMLDHKIAIVEYESRTPNVPP